MKQNEAREEKTKYEITQQITTNLSNIEINGSTSDIVNADWTKQSLSSLSLLLSSLLPGNGLKEGDAH